ncbi:hypothetical protein V8C35DRAFT_310841 [Trichoderma chlorosporum]
MGQDSQTHKGLLGCRRHVQRHRRRCPAATARTYSAHPGIESARSTRASHIAQAGAIAYALTAHLYRVLVFGKQALCYIARPRGCYLHGDSIARCLLRPQLQSVQQQQQQQGSPCDCWLFPDICLKIMTRGTLAGGLNTACVLVVENQTGWLRWLLGTSEARVSKSRAETTKSTSICGPLPVPVQEFPTSHKGNLRSHQYQGRHVLKCPGISRQGLRRTKKDELGKHSDLLGLVIIGTGGRSATMWVGATADCHIQWCAMDQRIRNISTRAMAIR